MDETRLREIIREELINENNTAYLKFLKELAKLRGATLKLTVEANKNPDIGLTKVKQQLNDFKNYIDAIIHQL